MNAPARKTYRPADRSSFQQGTAFDRIKYYYLGKLREEKLRPTDRRIMERWENIWRLYKTHLKASLAVKYHVAWCEKEGQPITERLAYNDLQNATKIWGRIARIDRQAKLLLLDEMATDVYLEAKQTGELGEMNRAVANLVKINEQVEEYLDDAREPHRYELHIHVKGEQRTLDLNQLPVKNAQFNHVLQELEEEETDEGTIAELIDEAQEIDADDSEV